MTIPRQSKIGFLSIAAAMFAMPFCAAEALPKDGPKNPVRLRIELDRPVLPADRSEKAIIKISLEGLRRERPESRPPANIAIVLDRSGSMEGDKIAQAKAAAIEALKRLAADDIFSLVAFGSKVETVIPAARVGGGGALESRIMEIRAEGMTALYGGVSEGASELRKNIEKPGYIHRMILLSDGQANQGPSTPEELGRLGSAFFKEGIPVTTVGLGLGYDEDLMTRLALRSDGNTYFVEGAPDLARIFKAEIGDALNVVARRATVEMEFPSGIRPIRFIGRNGSINGQSAEVAINQIYGGEEKYALVEVEVQAGAENTERTVVNAKAVFEDPVSQQTSTLSAMRKARFSADEKTVAKYANHGVQTEYAKNIVALAQEKAIVLIDAGRQQEAAKLMKENASSLNSLANAYGISAVAGISEDLEKKAKSIEAHGFGATSREKIQNRKIMQSNAASTQNQQKNAAVTTSGQWDAGN